MASHSDLTGKRVLISGASGFTGRYMAQQLKEQGCTVIGVGTRSDGTGTAGTDEFWPMDLRDAADVARIVAHAQADYVVHLAAVAFVGHGDADDFYRVNLLGTRNLLQALAASRHRPERVLIASSANVYGNATEGVIDEAVTPAPANDYAVSKLAMEYVASLWRERLSLVIARPFNYTGVGQATNFLIPKIVSHFASHASSIELGNTEVWRDFGDVRSVVLAYRKLLQAPAAEGQIVNVCSGVASSLGDIIGICSKITGHDIDVQVNPAFVRENEVKKLLGSNARLQELIGDWQSLALEDTLRWMLEASCQY
ncbi:NAD-dependent epimerase/dehydratase family protein [Xanthomonas euvesicatoria]|uniref:NAD-dependent epimerase/dehydratase family protein n=1 Tax=Xanthomonas euvesicatoria TaxID=456327 RepID=A0A6B3KLP8_XANEU|nr:NAD-dependent epimerase/dehydratase family protein [Xanthomonas euvesicatoria]MBV6792627.1 NAD-dependent epimerase/dehydratase family protein [Xanthomonas campestris pv. daturae]KLB46305.1 GDP-6-deoxy-D-lyxo-4-hexulose reductase [Xanthomonas euvesicatoria]KLB68238.1 GDP-6-deoxy-D-lyxo-4-hexulose reductase [Xanthomonas euvesicatoria]MBV6688214.1 NAD-dependent epimerase/dehydratase family protein [Xanthomonas euvesicatoria pv. physalidis]MDC9659728.1 GDP-mannose 4,6-dehydratase [Xanthomonas e